VLIDWHQQSLVDPLLLCIAMTEKGM
jgi:hypothetical protein